MRVVLTSPPELCRNALLWGLPVAHIAYRYAGGALWKQPLPDTLHGGYMALSVAPGPYSCRDAAQALARECSNMGFSGIVAEPAAPGAAFPVELQELLLAKGLSLTLSEAWGDASDRRTEILASTALSGGTLHARLEELAACYGAKRIALDVELLSHRFTLPCRNGQGERLTRERLQFLTGAAGPALYSPDLGCKYCFLPAREGLDILLFDDAESVTNKLRLARSFGIGTAVFLFGEAGSAVLDAAMRF